MELLGFTYTDAKGQTKAWRIAKWEEAGKYLKRVCVDDNKFRTFRKDRIVSYHDGVESLLIEPWPAPPPITSNPDILFTGVVQARRAEFEALAEVHGMALRKTVTKGLVFLCCGPKKVEAARGKSCQAMFEENFVGILERFEVSVDLCA